MPQHDFPKALARHDEADKERAAALAHVQRLCQQGRRREVVPFLLRSMRNHPALEKIRLWQLDAVMFNTGRDRAYRTIRKTRELIHDSSVTKDGFCNLGWATQTPELTVRLTTWLYELLRREGLADLHIDETAVPYGWLFDDLPDGNPHDPTPQEREK